MILVVPSKLSSAFAAFRRDRRPDDELSELELRFSSLDDPAFGLNPSLSRRVRATSGTTTVLVPGDGVVADIDRGGGGVAGLHQLLDGSATGSIFRGTGRLVVHGVLPDGVEEVRITRRNGSEVVVVVPDHLYAVEMTAEVAGQLPAEVVFSLDGQEHRFAVPGAGDEVLTTRSPSRRH